MSGYFIQVLIYLSTAVIIVPVVKRLGLGSVLGYLVAGVVIGPVAGIVGSETEALQHFAEFGIVMMLFVVGLELEPKILWAMRHKLIGLGGLQVTVTALLITAVALGFAIDWRVALTIGLIFSLSSTAIILQTFSEKGLSKTEGGLNAFSVLLFQDIAVIPMLAFIPLLALPDLIDRAKAAVSTIDDPDATLSLIAGLSDWQHGIVIVLAIATVVIGGHFLSRPIFRFVVASGVREIFTATALLLVIGIAILMSLVGLSPALGTFLAGVTLANSEFRHELESNLEPFKGLLLGLFFITVGAGIKFELLTLYLFKIISLTLLVIVTKLVILWILASLFKIKNSDKWLFALSLAQAGEFGFVLLGYSVQNHIFTKEFSDILSLVVALSMFLTPVFFIFFDKVIVSRYILAESPEKDESFDKQGSVIIAGMGRFGQVVNRLLKANGINTIALDRNIDQINTMRSVGIESYYGDVSHSSLLHTAGISEARILIVAIDDKKIAVELVGYVKHSYPKVRILTRAFDRGHYFELLTAGADLIVSETYFSALELGEGALKALDMHPYKALQKKETFIDIESMFTEELYTIWRDVKEENRLGDNYRDMFIKVNTLLSEAMQEERGQKPVDPEWMAQSKHEDVG